MSLALEKRRSADGTDPHFEKFKSRQTSTNSCQEAAECCHGPAFARDDTIIEKEGHEVETVGVKSQRSGLGPPDPVVDGPAKQCWPKGITLVHSSLGGQRVIVKQQTTWLGVAVVAPRRQTRGDAVD